MTHPKFKRLPKHIGVIPDGNRRWAVGQGLPKQDGYRRGLEPGMMLYELCLELGIPELTFYGFTQDNTKRPAVQTRAFQKACVDAVRMLANRDAALLVIGDYDSPLFPRELLEFKERKTFGRGLIKINFLVNYGWKWDLNHLMRDSLMAGKGGSRNVIQYIASRDISRVDLIIRWGGRRRLSGFLPVQSIYSDFYVLDDLWPDFKKEHFYEAMQWYENQDVTLGG
ncbi:polyprenyl diphosphate synthase [Desulfoscipio geothermicus]|jgi:undecaprenyl diphosphate synthase|uniref:Undecaprenyl diphosphate synthase n=1 Tax=Desulfoscipio geothermicus DSM 3669 TaxID=1121426 RepID=A0A1I6E734_9FIRM|nr:polyprenyl diphosphate synthase [Desulfoscipio geothermicus]SFR13554.1 undecaprenyl diphosphate synthase [Desulfoscipio geothermicus DSM 3669]